MHVVIAGASGFLGSALTEHLSREGHEVTRLVRRPAGAGESRWDPYAAKVDLDLIEIADVVVNLAGSPLAHWPWTASYAKTFADSRVKTTKVLADAIAGSATKPAFLAQNGVAGYGDRGADVVTEDDPTDSSTLFGLVTREWEEATGSARDAGSRVVVLRTAVVLGRGGGMLRPMLIPFRLGLGATIGDGRQYLATISLHDWLRAVTFLAASDTASGPVNLAGPGTTTNKEFTRELARQLHRPAALRIPAWPLRRLLGPVAPDVLGSIRVEPRRLLDEGFAFEHTTLQTRLRSALSPSRPTAHR